MFLRIKDRLINLSNIVEIDLDSRPNRTGGPEVRIKTVGLDNDNIKVSGPEAEALRVFFARSVDSADVRMDFDPRSFDELDVVSFGPVDLAGRAASPAKGVAS